MRRGIKALLVLAASAALALSLAACGGSGDSGSSAASSGGAAAPQENSMLGYWVCDDLLVDGESMGMAPEELANFMALEVREDSMASVVMGSLELDEAGNEAPSADGGMMPCAIGENTLTIDMYGEEATFTLEDGKLVMNETEEGSTISYVFVKAEARPALFDLCPEATLYFDFTPEQSVAMSNFMRGGTYLIEDATLYGRFLQVKDGTQAYQFAKRSWPAEDAGKIGLELDDPVLLDADCTVSNLFRDGEWLYYVGYYRLDESTSICRVHDDGTGKEVLLTAEGDGLFDYLQMNAGRLWFTDENNLLCSMTADGKDKRVEWADQELYYPYFVSDEWLLAQVDEDNERLYLLHPESGAAVPVSDGRSYNPIIVGQDIYYTHKADGEDVGYLTKVSVFSQETKRSEKPIYGGFTFDGEKFLIDTQESNIFYAAPADLMAFEGKALDANWREYTYVSGGYQIEIAHEPVGDGKWQTSRYLYYDGTGTPFVFFPEE